MSGLVMTIGHIIKRCTNVLFTLLTGGGCLFVIFGYLQTSAGGHPSMPVPAHICYNVYALMAILCDVLADLSRPAHRLNFVGCSTSRCDRDKPPGLNVVCRRLM